MKKNEALHIESIQYVYDKEFEKQWKAYYFSLVRKELYKLLEDVLQHEENGDIRSQVTK
ncbi:MAG: hypothetical protein ACI35O_00700 [Bacillaceae bacterium]